MACRDRHGPCRDSRWWAESCLILYVWTCWVALYGLGNWRGERYRGSDNEAARRRADEVERIAGDERETSFQRSFHDFNSIGSHDRQVVDPILDCAAAAQPDSNQ